MLEQFKVAYEIHAWLRRAVAGGLIAGSVLLYWLAGGFPPQAWLLFVDVLPQLGQLWRLRGVSLLFPLTLLLIQCLTWVICWAVLVGAVVAVVRNWQSRRHNLQLFEDELQVAHDAVTQEQEVMTPPTKTRSERLTPPPQFTQQPLVLPGNFEHLNTAQPWQRQLSLHLKTGLGWDVGTTRKQKPNEDSLVSVQGTCIYNHRLLPFGLFVVADGMGGHANGQEASYLSIQTVVKIVLPAIIGSDELGDEMLVDLLAEGVQQANYAVYQSSCVARAEMGATITAALVLDKTAFVVNVGDSRTYLYREGEGLSQVTRDHSQVARLVAAGQIAQNDIYTHPDRNQVYRGLGAETSVEVDWFKVPLQCNDCLLLCSDGLWEMVRDPEIERLLKLYGGNPAQASKALTKAALQGGGLDNISAIVVHVTPETV